MQRKTLIWVGLTVGGFIGGYLPVVFGSGELSFSSVILTAVGSTVGIWIAFKMSAE